MNATTTTTTIDDDPATTTGLTIAQAREIQGNANRDAGNEFERRIAPTFAAYAKIGRAHLAFMPIPSRMVWRGGKAPVLIPKGKAPFDVYGYAPVEAAACRLAISVGAELKHSRDVQDRIPIVAPKSSAKGVAYHQLFSLALLAQLGGVARIVWDNGGTVGVLTEAKIVEAFHAYDRSLMSEKRGAGRGERGLRSIPWAAFAPVEFRDVAGDGVSLPDWLPSPVKAFDASTAEAA